MVQFKLKWINDNGLVEVEVKEFKKKDIEELLWIADEIEVQKEDLKIYFKDDDGELKWVEIKDKEFINWSKQGKNFTHIDCINYIFRDEKE